MQDPFANAGMKHGGAAQPQVQRLNMIQIRRIRVILTHLHLHEPQQYLFLCHFERNGLRYIGRISTAHTI
jgi:hypothetical protein